MLHIFQLFDKLNGKEIVLQGALYLFLDFPSMWACLREFANDGYSGAKEHSEHN